MVLSNWVSGVLMYLLLLQIRTAGDCYNIMMDLRNLKQLTTTKSHRRFVSFEHESTVLKKWLGISLKYM